MFSPYSWKRRSQQPSSSEKDSDAHSQGRRPFDSFETFSVPPFSSFASDPIGRPLPPPHRPSAPGTYTMPSSRLSVEQPLTRGSRVSTRRQDPQSGLLAADRPMMASSGSSWSPDQHLTPFPASRLPVKGFRSKSRFPWTRQPNSPRSYEKPLPPRPRTPYASQSQRHIAVTPERSLEHSLATPFTKLSGPSDAGSSGVDDEAKTAPFGGSGTAMDPYLVDFLPGEGCNPYNWSKGFRWAITAYLAVNCLCPVFVSSSYIGGIADLEVKFPGTSQELAVSGMTFYMLGQALGPLLWAPLSEVIGRRQAFLWSFPLFVLFNLVGAVAKNMTTILVIRFLSGIFGASPVTNLGGQMGDLWMVQDRVVPGGLAMLSPMLGPCIGPIVCNWVGQKDGFRAVFWVQFGFGLAMLVSWVFLIPETYAPTLLARRTKALQAEAEAAGTGEVFISKYEKGGKKPLAQVLKVGLGRPFVLLFKEVIVWTLSLYLAVVYGILYLLFTAFPVIFVELRGWSLGMSGLGLLGIAIGMIIGFVINGFSRKLYAKARANTPAHLPVPPEVRLPTMCLGAILAPVGLFWFAWTSGPNVHWIVPIIASVPFGTGFLLIFTAILLYLIDSYTIYAASALAANTVTRMVLGAMFPLVADKMFTNLGVNWAGTLLAFLSLACAPIPFLFYRYGARLRRRSQYAPSQPAAPAPPPSFDPEKGTLLHPDTHDHRQAESSFNRAATFSSPRNPNQGDMAYPVPAFTLSDGFDGFNGFRGFNRSDGPRNAENQISPSPASTGSTRQQPFPSSGSGARLADRPAEAIYHDGHGPNERQRDGTMDEVYDSRDDRDRDRNRGVSMYSERERLVGQDGERERQMSFYSDPRALSQYEEDDRGPVKEQEPLAGYGYGHGYDDFRPLELRNDDGVDIGSGSLRDSFYGKGWWRDE